MDRMEAEDLPLQMARSATLWGQCSPSLRLECGARGRGLVVVDGLVIVDALAGLPWKLMGTLLSAWTGLAATGAALACTLLVETPAVLAVWLSSRVTCLSTDIWLLFANGGALKRCVVECRERLEC
jgi:hypothetical protein